MGQYVLQRGTHTAFDKSIGDRRKFVKGEIVELTPQAAKSFADKFKSIDVVAAEARVAEAQLRVIKDLEEQQAQTPAKSLNVDAVVNKDQNSSGGSSPAADQKDDGKSAEAPGTNPKSGSQSEPQAGTASSKPTSGGGQSPRGVSS